MNDKYRTTLYAYHVRFHDIQIIVEMPAPPFPAVRWDAETIREHANFAIREQNHWHDFSFPAETDIRRISFASFTETLPAPKPAPNIRFRRFVSDMPGAIFHSFEIQSQNTGKWTSLKTAPLPGTVITFAHDKGFIDDNYVVEWIGVDLDVAIQHWLDTTGGNA